MVDDATESSFESQEPSPAEDDAVLVDENAYGFFVSWFDAEEVEYSQSADKFPPRVIVFRSAVQEYLATHPLGPGTTAIDLGTAVYVEIADGDQTEDPIAWMRSLRAYLAQGDWTTFGVIAHGGRWAARGPEGRMPSQVGGVTVLASFGPSEPFRKAMIAEAMSHDDDEAGEEGWHSGLFVDEDVLESLGRKLKNDPTPLRHAGTCFFRIGR